MDEKLSLPYTVSNNIVDMSKLRDIPGLKTCHNFFNGVFPKFGFKEIMLLRCVEEEKGVVKSSIKIVMDKKAVKLNITETQEYLTWNGDGNFWYQFFGPEDPRIFEFNSRLYIYYTMTNPKRARPYRGIEFIKLEDAVAGSSRGTFLTPHIFNDGSTEVEKNWLFFNNGTNLLALYSLKPYVLAEVEGENLKARIRRDYQCLDPLQRVHFSSNAIKINNYGNTEYLFVFNDKYESDNHPKEYFAYLGFMQSKPPFNLLRISKEPLKLKVNQKRFLFIESLTVLGKSELYADKDDIVLVSGGMDDESIFLEQIRVSALLNLETQKCGIDNAEFDYFQIGEPCDSTGSPSLLLSIFVVVTVFLVWFQRNGYWRRRPNKKKNKQFCN